MQPTSEQRTSNQIEENIPKIEIIKLKAESLYHRNINKKFMKKCLKMPICFIGNILP